MSLLKELFFIPGVGPNPHSTDLELTIPGTGEPTHKFSKIAHVIGKGDKLTITLQQKGPGNGTSSIIGYCSTETDPSKIKLESIKTGSTVNTTPGPAPYPPGTTEITFELDLGDQKMILIGIIVEVDRPGIGKKRYLCDPQVGNGPP